MRAHAPTWPLSTRILESDQVVRIAHQATASDFPALTAFVRRVFEIPGIAETVRFDHILAHYFDSDWSIPPRRGIVPNLTEMAWYSPTGG